MPPLHLLLLLCASAHGSAPFFPEKMTAVERTIACQPDAGVQSILIPAYRQLAGMKEDAMYQNGNGVIEVAEGSTGIPVTVATPTNGIPTTISFERLLQAVALYPCQPTTATTIKEQTARPSITIGDSARLGFRIDALETRMEEREEAFSTVEADVLLALRDLARATEAGTNITLDLLSSLGAIQNSHNKKFEDLKSKSEGLALSLERTAKRLGDDLNETRQAANNIRAPRDPTCPKCVCVCEEEKKTTVKTPPIKRPEVAECGEEATFAGLGTALAVQLVAVIALLAKAFRARREERKLRGLVGEFSKLSQASIDLVRRSGGGSRGGSGHHPPLMIEELMENSLSRLSPAAKAFLDRYPVGGEETMVKERFGQEEEYKESAGP